jgi:hypothetical protein
MVNHSQVTNGEGTYVSKALCYKGSVASFWVAFKAEERGRLSGDGFRRRLQRFQGGWFFQVPAKYEAEIVKTPCTGGLAPVLWIAQSLIVGVSNSAPGQCL